MLSAGVSGGWRFGPDFDHMTLMVTLAERGWWTSASVIHFEPLCQFARRASAGNALVSHRRRRQSLDPSAPAITAVIRY